ncbi:MAG: nitrate reductase molybdenum cofactor assembly chaperone [Gammaproteobacteria bacterium]|nr:nitrate reductase molybdenum cofactor assembly chaperone [Gammaproteobacteria bacterium]
MSASASVYAVAARLLDYPTEELKGNLAHAAARVEQDRDLDPVERERLLGAIAWMQRQDLLDLQAEYTQTFDLTPEHSLHLTHHTFGDSRERGPALAELAEHYKALGLQAVDGELPDYLPLMLEYAARLDPVEAEVFLRDAAAIVGTIATRLEQADNPYAPLIRFVAGRGRLAQAA